MEIRFIPTKQMAKNASLALEVRASKPPSQRGMTPVGLARARQLISRDALSMSIVKRMASFFARHEVDKEGSTWKRQGKGWQAWMGWGGDAGRDWAEQVIAEYSEYSE